MPDWGELFGWSTPVLEVVMRGTAVYLGVVVLMRVVGQRESGSPSVTDLLVVVLIGGAAGATIVGEGFSITETLAVIAVVLVWSVTLDALGYRHPRLGRLLKSRPQPLIEDGKVNRRKAHREFLSDDELTSQLRLHGVDDVGQVKRAYLEPNGMLSVFTYDDDQAHPAPESPPAAS